jgi:hypothetical protein
MLIHLGDKLMTDYANKLAAIADKEQALQTQKAKLIELRKKEIGELAERFELLGVSDEILHGAFNDIADAIKLRDTRIKNWEDSGERFLKGKKLRSEKTTTNNHATATA